MDLCFDQSHSRLGGMQASFPGTGPLAARDSITIKWPVLWLLLEALTIGMLDAVTVPALKVFVG